MVSARAVWTLGVLTLLPALLATSASALGSAGSRAEMDGPLGASGDSENGAAPGPPESAPAGAAPNELPRDRAPDPGDDAPDRPGPFIRMFFGAPAVTAIMAGSAAAASAAGLSLSAPGRVLLRRLAAFGPTLTGLFSRLNKDRLLDQGTRSRLFEAIRQEPGIRFRDLQVLFGLPKGAMYHHLRMMERHGLVRSRRWGQSRIYQTADGPRLTPDRLPLSAPQTRFLEALRAIGTADRNALASRLGVTPQAVSHHAKVLASLGLVKVRYEGRQMLCTLPLAVAAENVVPAADLHAVQPIAA